MKTRLMVMLKTSWQLCARIINLLCGHVIYTRGWPTYSLLVLRGREGTLCSPCEEQSIIFSCIEHTHSVGHQKLLFLWKMECGVGVSSAEPSPLPVWSSNVTTNKLAKQAAEFCSYSIEHVLIAYFRPVIT